MVTDSEDSIRRTREASKGPWTGQTATVGTRGGYARGSLASGQDPNERAGHKKETDPCHLSLGVDVELDCEAVLRHYALLPLDGWFWGETAAAPPAGNHSVRGTTAEHQTARGGGSGWEGM
jgi:hypothetical protein